MEKINNTRDAEMAICCQIGIYAGKNQIKKERIQEVCNQARIWAEEFVEKQSATDEILSLESYLLEQLNENNYYCFCDSMQYRIELTLLAHKYEEKFNKTNYWEEIISHEEDWINLYLLKQESISLEEFFLQCLENLGWVLPKEPTWVTGSPFVKSENSFYMIQMKNGTIYWPVKYRNEKFVLSDLDKNEEFDSSDVAGWRLLTNEELHQHITYRIKDMIKKILSENEMKNGSANQDRAVGIYSLCRADLIKHPSLLETLKTDDDIRIFIMQNILWQVY